MNLLLAAQAAGQLLSLAVFLAISRWHVIPWLQRQPKARALTALLWVHVFRYVALQVFAAQQEGFPISVHGANEIVIGDLAGAALAFVAIVLLRRGNSLGALVAGIMAVGTVVDTVLNISNGIREHLMGAATGVTWMILCFFVPAVVVSTGLIIWQLLARRSERLDAPSPMRSPTQATVANA